MSTVIPTSVGCEKLPTAVRVGSARMRRLIAVPLAVLAVLLTAWPAAAETFTVTSTADGAGACPPVRTLECTLRAAVTAAGNGPDATNTITVPQGSYVLTAGALSIPKTTTISGAGQRLTTISGNNASRIFSVSAERILILSGVTLTNGSAVSDPNSPYGGAIVVMSGARLFATGVRVTNSTAPGGGGGIAVYGGQSASIASSLIDTNTTAGPGGGIAALPPPGGSAGSVAIADSTVAFNTAASGAGIASLGNAATAAERITLAYNRSGGGLAQGGVKITVKSSVLAGNAPANCGTAVPVDNGQNVESGADCGFTTGSQNADPRLAGGLEPLNGTFVLPLLAGSPAIDRAVDCGTATQDQAGTARPVGVACDAGAFEYVPPPPPAPTPTPSVSPAPPTISPSPPAAPAPTPVFHQTVVVGPVSGTILVREPGSPKFKALTAVQALKLGSTVDARKGVVTLTSMPKAGGKPETAKFYAGMFKVTQSGDLTTLTLNEPLASCRAAKNASAAAKKPKTRKLWGDGKGRFRTKGQYSAATIRGTKWLVQDGCRYTRTRVAIGAVSVRDSAKRKTIILRKGETYTAKPRR